MSALLRKRRVVWFLALGLLLVLAVAGYLSGRRYLDASQWVTHTFEVTEAIDRAQASAQEIEASQRGFLLSGDPEFLDPYREARASLPETLTQLRHLVRDNAGQAKRVDRLELVMLDKVAFAEQTLALKNAGGDYETVIKTGRGKRIMDDIRQVAREMRLVEHELLAERTEHAAGAQRQTIVMCLLGVAITLGLVLFSLAMVHRDLRELQLLSEDLAVAEKMFRDLAENASELVILMDLEGHVTYASPSSERLLGFTPDEFRALEPSALVWPDDLEPARAWVGSMLETGTSVGTMSLRYRTKHGQFRWLEVSASVLRDGTGSSPSILYSARDIHERRLAQEALEQKKNELETLSTTDGLTGLLNRRGFMDRSLGLLEEARSGGRQLAVVFVDLDGLKPINDQLGHEAGDRALSEAGRVLRQICRGGDLVARLGGDEFAVLARDLTPPGYVHFKERIEAALRELNAEGDRPFRLGFSLGAAFFDPTSAESLDSLLKRADAVMYEEKRQRSVGRG